MNIDIDDLMMCALSVWNSAQKEFLQKSGAPSNTYYTRYFAILQKPQDYHQIMNTVLTTPHSPAEFAAIFQHTVNTISTPHHFKEQVGLAGSSSNEKINEAAYQKFLEEALRAVEYAPSYKIKPFVFHASTWEEANTQMKESLQKGIEQSADSFSGCDPQLWEHTFKLSDIEYKWKKYHRNDTTVSDRLSANILHTALEKYNQPDIVKDIANTLLSSWGTQWRTTDYVKRVWEGVFVCANWDREALGQALGKIIKSEPAPQNCFFAKNKP